MSEWKEVRLGNIADIQTGPFGSQLHQRDYVDIGTPCIMPTNIGSNLEIATDNIAHIEDEDVKRLSKYCVREGDIIYSRRGDIEKCAYIKKEEEGWLCGTGCLRIRINVEKGISHFVAYQLSTKVCKKWVVNNAVGTTMPNLNTGILKDLPLLMPPMDTQAQIVSILKSFDDKIAVNRRICENLEAQAQALFKHWFIDFAPFLDKPSGKAERKNGNFCANREQNETCFNSAEVQPKITGKACKFVESELGMIPEGWRVGRLGDVADITMGQSPAGSSYNEKGEGIFFYQGRTEFGFRYPSVRLYTTEPKRFAEPLSTLLSVRAPVGDINVATDKCCIGRGLASIKSNNNCHSYIFYLLQSMKRRFDVYNGEGTVFGSINKDTLNGLKIIIPSNSILLGFEEIVEEMDKKILGCHQENLRLSTLRDTLLPKLMSGQIKVNEMEKSL